MLNSKELELQSMIKIDKWIDVSSQECKEIDQFPGFTKKILELGFAEPAFLFTDELGRIYGKGDNEKYYPLHDEFCGQKIGYRVVKKAAN